MRNFQDTFETLKRPFIRAFSICMRVPLMSLKYFWKVEIQIFCYLDYLGKPTFSVQELGHTGSNTKILILNLYFIGGHSSSKVVLALTCGCFRAF